MLSMNDLTRCLRPDYETPLKLPKRFRHRGHSIRVAFKSPRNTNLDTKILESLSRLSRPFHQIDFSGSTHYGRMDLVQDTMEVRHRDGNRTHEIMTHKAHTYFEAMGLAAYLKHLGDEALLHFSPDGHHKAFMLYKDAITFEQLWIDHDQGVECEQMQLRPSHTTLRQTRFAACLCNMATAYFTGSLNQSPAKEANQFGDMTLQGLDWFPRNIDRLSRPLNNPHRHLELAYLISLVRLVDLRACLEEGPSNDAVDTEQWCSVLLHMQQLWSRRYHGDGISLDHHTILGKMYAMTNSLLADPVLTPLDPNVAAAVSAAQFKASKIFGTVDSMLNLLRSVKIAPVKWCFREDLLAPELANEIVKLTHAREEDLRDMRRSAATTGGVYDGAAGPMLLMFPWSDPLSDKERGLGRTRLRFML